MGYESKVRPHNIPEINSKDDFAKLPNGAIYVFKIDNFREVKPTNEVLGFNPLGEIKFPIRLYLNAETLNDATIIGIRPKFDSREIIFLTSIPASAIIGIVDFSNEDYYISFE